MAADLTRVPLFRVHMPPVEELLPALHDVLWGGHIGQGPVVDAFEHAFGGWLGTSVGERGVLAVNSGTSAIQLALRLAGVRGGTVISSPMTCAATNMPILAEGADITWADIDPATGNIDPTDVERKVTADTRAILAVHWGGQPCDLGALNAIGGEYGIPVIEDAAHALGAEWDGRMIGAGTADYTAFSLQAIKHVTTVDGGILTTAPGSYYRAKLLRWYGLDRDQAGTDGRVGVDAPDWGYKFHMNDVTATVGLAQLPHLDRIVEAHQLNAAYYDHVLAGRYGTKRPAGKGTGAWWLYTVLLADAGARLRFMEHMDAAGISVSQVHRRNDTLACFWDYRTHLPGVDEFSARMCCVPVHWALSAADRDHVARAMAEFR